MESNPRTKSAVDGRETAQGDISEEITMRNAFGNTAELHTEGEAITIISLPTCKHQQLTNRKTLEGWPSKCLACRAIEKDPILRKPFKCLMHGATEKDKSKRPFEH